MGSNGSEETSSIDSLERQGPWRAAGLIWDKALLLQQPQYLAMFDGEIFRVLDLRSCKAVVVGFV